MLMPTKHIVSVTLTEFEMEFAFHVGAKRNTKAILDGKKDANGFDNSEGKGWHIQMEGACGEMAVAKYLGVYWNGSFNTYMNGADVGDFLQVRTRTSPKFELYVRPNDANNKIYCLAIGLAPHYNLIGWIRGEDAKRDDWLRDHGGRKEAHFVPQPVMRKMRTLRKAITEEHLKVPPPPPNDD